MTGTIKKLLENDEIVCRVLTDLQAAFDIIIIMELEVKKMTISIPFLSTENNMCQ